MERLRMQIILVIIGVVILFNVAPAIRLYTDFLWFDSLGLRSVFFTGLSTRVGLWVVGGLFFLAVLTVNFLVARRNLPRYMVGPTDEIIFFQNPQLQRYSGLIYFGVAIFASLSAAAAASAQWLTFLAATNGTAFGKTDPILARDIGFYIFSLPGLWALWTYLLGVVLISLGLVAAYYAINGAIAFIQGARQFAPYVIRHLQVLLAILVVLLAAAVLLGRHNLMYSSTGAVQGPGYTDATFTLPLLLGLGAAIAAVGVLLVLALYLRLGAWLRGAAAAVLALAVITLFLPVAVQQFRVVPNELRLERPYLEHNIAFTRDAFGLDEVSERAYPVENGLTLADIQANSPTIDNIRLWDWRPLLRTFGQLQEIRLYYTFRDVDVDRYIIDGRLQQVTLAARELDPRQLTENARTWVNTHQVFLHGYGAVMNPVTRFTTEGLPIFYIKDIPPKSSVDLSIERPEIYFGEVNNEYALVRTATKEFDYPVGDSNALTTYEGKDGVSISSALNRAAFSARLGTARILLSGAIRSESRIVINRNILVRARALAPFLTFDTDPYLVIDGQGRLQWIIDAYTTSGRYPYSERLGGTNYIRNSVKTVVDAYNGTVDFYVVEPDDPVVSTYRKVFPKLFKDFEDMPEDLRAHIRYPVGLFNAQSRIFSAYHMTDPQTFYNREDQWEIPREVLEGQEQPVEPYYVIMRPPGEDKEEFILLLPFTPRNKNNMISWMFAGNDGDNYGKLSVFKFPKDTQLFGPTQIEARIDQDPAISQQLTLWSQGGSDVIRGNLLVIPIEKSLLYVEPLYLRAERSELPELKRVIVAYAGRVVMEPTLDEALAKVFAPGQQAARPEPAPARDAEEPDADGQPEVPASIQELAEQAGERFRKAQELAQEGDWAGYGREIKALEDAINELQQKAADTPQ